MGLRFFIILAMLSSASPSFGAIVKKVLTSKKVLVLQLTKSEGQRFKKGDVIALKTIHKDYEGQLTFKRKGRARLKLIDLPPVNQGQSVSLIFKKKGDPLEGSLTDPYALVGFVGFFGTDAFGGGGAVHYKPSPDYLWGFRAHYAQQDLYDRLASQVDLDDPQYAEVIEYHLSYGTGLVYGRYFLGSFFAQGGLGYQMGRGVISLDSETHGVLHEIHSSSPVVQASLGQQWLFEGVSLGIQYVGVSLPFSPEAKHKVYEAGEMSDESLAVEQFGEEKLIDIMSSPQFQYAILELGVRF